MTTAAPERHTYAMAPLIRRTLLTLYLALCLPLPVMAPLSLRPGLWGAVLLGWVGMVALTSERVVLDRQGLQVRHPAWCAWWLRRGWQLSWDQVGGLIPVATSQGGRVFYVQARAVAEKVTRAYLLPQRVEHFDDFLQRFADYSGVSTTAVERISPPWTYRLLAVLSATLLAGEAVALALNS